MRIRNIHIKGFKSIFDQSFELGRLNCFIGANGSGKSNLLEAIGVLSAAASGRVDDEAIMRRGVRAGLPRLFKTSFANTPIPPHIFLEAKGEPSAAFRVSLLNPLENPSPAWSFKSESLSSGDLEIVTRAPRGKKKLNLDETAGLVALKLVELSSEIPASFLLKALQSYAIYSPNTPALRATVPDPHTRSPVGLAGGGLAEGFEVLKRTLEEDSFDNILELIDWTSEISTTEYAGTLLSPAIPRAKRVLKFTLNGPGRCRL